MLDHYLKILLRKPGALPGSVPPAQTRAAGTFTAAHQQLWDTARARLGAGAGTRTLIEVLLLHRRLPAASVRAGDHRGAERGDLLTGRGGGRGPQARRWRCRQGPQPAAAPRPSGAAVITLPHRQVWSRQRTGWRRGDMAAQPVMLKRPGP